MTKHYKVSDIKISTDSVGFRTATHLGKILIDSALFESREECRKEAAKIIHEMNEEYEHWLQEMEWEREQRKLEND